MNWSDVWTGLQLNWLGLTAALCVAIVCAYLGVFVVLRRIVFVGLTLAQVSGAGIALAFLAGPTLARLGHAYVHGATPLSHVGFCFEWLAVRPIVVSLALTMLGVWLFARHAWSPILPRDSIIGAGYVTAYALTLVFILRSPKGMEDVRELLDGNVLASSASDVLTLGLVCAAVLLVQTLVYKQTLFAAFDPEGAAAQGYAVERWELLFYVTLGLTITVAMLHAGILSVFAYLTIPPIIGLTASRRMGGVILVSLASAVVSSVLGFVLALKWDLPLSPPTIGAGLGILAVVAGIRRLGLR